jgi:hypothetical protein
MFRSLPVAVLVLAGLTQYGLAQTAVDTATYADGVKLLDQNWSHDERLEWYYTSQGSAALRYGIFVAVEQADTQDLFRSDANLARFGFVTQPVRGSGWRAARRPIQPGQVRCVARSGESRFHDVS